MRVAAGLAVFALTGPISFAQATGTLAGRVTDASTRLALGGAHIAVSGTALEVFADPSGNYTLTNVPLGVHTVTAGYLGYEPLQRTVTVGAGGANADFIFNETVQLERLVISGSAVGTARALNQQRAASTLTSIVAADEIGRFPDQNAAESLQRLPGVSLYRDQGEGRFVDLRGLNYIYTAVTLNGAKVASPEVGGRFIALDVVPADSLSSLEVTKVPTPDMDGEGLGGVVNIKTKSPFDAEGGAATASAQGIYSKLSDKLGSKYNFSTSTLFAGGKAGLLVAGTWQKREFGSYNYEVDDGWELRDAPGGGESFFLQDIVFREYEIERTRYGATAALEFRPDAFTSFSLKGTYNRFTDNEDRNVSFIPFARGTVTQLDDTSATITGVSRTRRDLRNRKKDQELFALSSEAEKKVGPWTLNSLASLSRGHEDKPSEIVARYRHNASDSTYRYVVDSPYELTVTKIAGAGDTGEAAFYERLDRASETSEEGKETEFNLGLNARYDFNAANVTHVKFGGSYRDKKKESAVEYYEYSAGPASLTLASLAEAQGDYPYFRAPTINSQAFRAAFTGNRSAFTGGLVPADSLLEDFTTREKILAGYALGGTTFGKTQLMAGVRVERTKFDTQGNELTDGGTPAITRAARSYTNTLPGIYLRHDWNQKLVFRASVSTSLMRPEFSETSAFRNINTDDEELEAGNPQLETLKSRNFDASVEYYLPSLGLVSAAVFHKEVKNFSYAITLPGGDPAYPDYDLISFRNGSDGDISGLELAYQQQLRFLPAPFDGFGFMVNTTLVDSSADYPTRPGENLRFIGQSDVTGNVALTYERAGFFARLALNWRSEHLREDEPVGDDATQDRYIDDFAQLDFSASYRLSRNWELFVEGTNLTNEPFRVYQQGGGLPGKRLVQFEEYDWTANFGVRWKL